MDSADDQLAALVVRLIQVFGVRETEENWQDIDHILKEICTLVPQCSEKVAMETFWQFKTLVAATLSTERTRLALTAIDLVQSMCAILVEKFEALYDVYLTPLLKLSERTNKVISQKALTTLIEIVRSDPVIGSRFYLGKIADGMMSANKSLRACVMEMLLAMIKGCKERKLYIFEENILSLIIRGLEDANPTVRQISRSVYNELEEGQKIFINERVPANVLKSLIAPNNTGSKPSIKTFIKQRLSVGNDPNDGKDDFVMLNDALSETPLFIDRLSEISAEEPRNVSRLPIGPAKRNPSNTSTPSVNREISKTALRVLKHVTEGESMITRSVLPVRNAVSQVGRPTPSVLASRLVPPNTRTRIISSVRDWNELREWNHKVDHLQYTITCTNLLPIALEIALNALTDIHFRVVEGGMKLCQHIIVKHNDQVSDEEIKFMEDVLVGIHSALLNHKGRKLVSEMHTQILHLLCTIDNPDCTHCHNISTNTSLIHPMVFGLFDTAFSRLDVQGSIRLRVALTKSFEDSIRYLLPTTNALIIANHIYPLVPRVSSALLDPSQILAATTRSLFLVIAGIVGERVMREEFVPAVKTPAARALLTALIGSVQPSLIPRSPLRCTDHNEDDQDHYGIDYGDEIVFRSDIILTAIAATPCKKVNGREIDELAEQLAMTPIK